MAPCESTVRGERLLRGEQVSEVDDDDEGEEASSSVPPRDMQGHSAHMFEHPSVFATSSCELRASQAESRIERGLMRIIHHVVHGLYSTSQSHAFSMQGCGGAGWGSYFDTVALQKIKTTITSWTCPPSRSRL